jgi:ligand-binding SRPBCC domain-containing protein
MKITYHSGLYVLVHETILQADTETVWKFLSDPANLNRLTPEKMNFSITFRSELSGSKMYPGQIICYRVTPIPPFRMSWITEITQVQEGKFFIDEQRFGPYRFWHHQHIIEPCDEGTLMRDIITYKLPFGLPGIIFGGPMVKKQLKNIFRHRENALKQIFPTT